MNNEKAPLVQPSPAAESTDEGTSISYGTASASDAPSSPRLENNRNNGTDTHHGIQGQAVLPAFPAPLFVPHSPRHSHAFHNTSCGGDDTIRVHHAEDPTMYLSPPQAYIDTNSERRRPSAIAAIAAADLIVRRESLAMQHQHQHPQEYPQPTQQYFQNLREDSAIHQSCPQEKQFSEWHRNQPQPFQAQSLGQMQYSSPRIPYPANRLNSIKLPPRPPLVHVPSVGSLSEEMDHATIGTTTTTSKIELDEESASHLDGGYFCDGGGNSKRMMPLRNTMQFTKYELMQGLKFIVSQIPAVAIASVLNFMVGIPFGASYFPVEWSASESGFPVPGKEALGLRMFLFATMVGQFVFTFKSNFNNGVGLQMVENVPFCLELARIVIQEQGYGLPALSTLFFLFGLSSVVVGTVFYLLGKFEYGRVVYFFPSHVLVGCIGGIGAFIIATSVEVSTNTVFHFTLEGVEECFIRHMHLWLPVLAFEVVLRILLKGFGDKYPLLAPIYYCLITPVFYFCLGVTGIDMDTAAKAGYFFPPISTSGSVFNKDMLDIFTIINIGTISWKAVVKAIPTMVSLTAFSLIHVPINIPAFAISTNVEPDMNAELIAHGYSNAVSGIFGGLQNYMAYSNSVIYSKSNGKGTASSLGIVAVSAVIFVYGPTMASYVPRCMAGTLLLHVGIDLFIEGVVESYHDYDRLEYSGIWLITVVMITFGMDAALVAGIIAALSTYAVQSITYQYPIRGAMTAARLRSSAWNRSFEAQEILMDKMKGRQRIYVIQMQGHIFFGNVTTMTDEIKRKLKEKCNADDKPIVVILDFSRVLGIDSSAAQTIAKLKDSILTNYGIELVLFVTGQADGFPCSYDLSRKVHDNTVVSATSKRLLEPKDALLLEEFDQDHIVVEIDSSLERNFDSRSSIRARALSIASKNTVNIAEIPNSRVCQTLDDALVFAEDVLVAIQDPDLLQRDVNESCRNGHRARSVESAGQMMEERGVKLFLETLCPGATPEDIAHLFSLLSREKYHLGDIIWEQGSASNNLKLLVCGSLISSLDDENGATETIYPGSTIGELGLINGTERLTTVKVLSDEAILYNLSREKWETLIHENPRLAREIDMLVVRYLTHRIQHVSNHILDKRSLPV